MGIEGLTYAMLIIFTFVTIGIGWFAQKRGIKTPTDYYVAGRSLGPVTVFFMIFAAFFSGFTFIGGGGMGYMFGLGWLCMIAGLPSIATFGTLVFGTRIRRLSAARGFSSPAELLGGRYNSSSLRLFLAILYVIFLFPYLAIQMTAVGQAMVGITGGKISYIAGVILFTVLVIIYVQLAGMRSVAWTNVFLGTVMLVVMVLLFGCIVYGLGGFRSAALPTLQAAPEHYARPGALGIFKSQISWFTTSLNFLLPFATLPHLLMGWMSAKSDKAIQTTGSLLPFAVIFGVVPIFFLGAWGFGYFPGLGRAQADQIVPLLLGKYVSPLLATALLAGAVAAIISTASSQMLCIAALFTHDMWVPFSKKGITGKKEVIVARVVLTLAGLIALLIAVKPLPLIILIAGLAFTGSNQVLVALVATLFWKRATAAGCIAGLIAGEATFLAFQFILPKSWLLGTHVIFPSLIINIILMIAVSYITTPQSKEELAKFGL